MRSWSVHLGVIVAIVGLLALGCAQAGPAAAPAAPTTKPAEPTKAAEATKAVAAPTKPAGPTNAPTAVPAAAKTVQYPAKGKAVTIVVPYAPGGSTDVGARLLAPVMEKELGVPVQIVNKAGAGSQTGLTDVVRASPDGYTLGQAVFPTTPSLYLDASRKAIFARKDFQPIAVYGRVPLGISVKADSPFKTAKDLVDTARAKPESVKLATAGLLTSTHTATLVFELATGSKFAYVHFDGGGPALTALMGGHVDAQTSAITAVLSQVKNGEIRVLGILEKDRISLYSDMPTMGEQGYKVVQTVYHAFVMPAGAPREVVDTLTRVVKKALEQDDVKKKMGDAGTLPDYLDPAQFEAMWISQENDMKAVIPLAK